MKPFSSDNLRFLGYLLVIVGIFGFIASGYFYFNRNKMLNGTTAGAIKILEINSKLQYSVTLFVLGLILMSVNRN